VPGDELYEEATGPGQSVPGVRRERTGPRHAAPKKPFLTRLHVPAGKAVAMAAMPSAVLMSLGVTPQLAYAKPLPKNPFSDGPCVSQQDRAEEEAEKEAEAAAKAEEERRRAEAERKAAEEKAQQEQEQEDAEQDDASGSGSGPGSGSGTGPDDDSEGGSTSSGGASGGHGGSPEAEPSPSEEEDGSGGLLGGVGDALGDLLGGGDREKEAEPEPSPSETPDVAGKESSDPVGDTVEEVGEGVEDTVGKVEDGLNDATDEALPDGSGDEESPSEETGEDEATDPADLPVGEDGKPAFPCVEEKKVAGEDGTTPAVLPNQPWTLKASSLSIRGQDYEGVFNVRTADGSTKQVLKFTADSIDIGDLHQIVQGPDGLQYHVKAAPGSTSTIRDGQVTLYTERLEGKLFGLIPITFDPEHPPPLNLPDVYFTDVTVQQAGQFGGTLTVPGLTSTITGG
jgi:hypothetical protein